jgi:hypothetical protein
MHEPSDQKLILFVPWLYDPHDQDQDLLLNLDHGQVMDLEKHSFHL